MRWFLLILSFALVSCGIKGPPLPPIYDTPQQEDAMTRPSPRSSKLRVFGPQPKPTESPEDLDD
jgi:predicted small lipoprotein YifL